MPCVFGPVPSRRLGLSLGVDLIPPKTCSYDCLYCEVGRTTCKSLKPEPYVSVPDLISELKGVLEKCTPEVITLAGSGEPTLNSQIGEVINAIREITDIKIALLTNGSLLQFREVRERISGVDIIIPTLNSVNEKTFRTIHRPHSDLRLQDIIRGLKIHRSEYSKSIYMETLILRGLNDTEDEISGLAKIFEEICPDRVQLNTVVRPPAYSEAVSVDGETLLRIKDAIGDRAEIIAPAQIMAGDSSQGTNADDVMEMVKRRPVTLNDIMNSLKLDRVEAERVIKALMIKGRIREQEHEGKIYLISR